MDSVINYHMDKRRPHYNLNELKKIVVAKGSDAFTLTALTNARVMGLSGSQSIDVILALVSSMFYKSMTTLHDASIWQDVYHAPTPVGKIAYIKITLQDGAVVIQFKEK